MKKLFATVLALVMMLSVMSVTAFAADSYTVSVPSDDNHTYSVYQIFTGDLSDGVLSNVKWGENGTGTKGEAVSATALEALEAVDSTASNPDKLAVINQYVNLSGTPVATIGAGGSYTAAPGYYLIKDAGEVDADDAYTTYIVQIVDNVTISRKADVPSVDKEILDPTEMKTNEASIGDEVKYQITGTLPTTLDDYNTYYYQFNDTMSKGLTYTANSMKVTVDGKDLTEYFYINASEYSKTDGTTITVSIQDLLALSKLEGVNITKDSKIVLTYSATLNENAVVAGNGNPNDVTLQYSNNPNDSGEPSDNPPTPPTTPPAPEHPTGETPKSEVKTYTTELTIKKIDEKGNILTGAEFQLTGDGVKVMVISADKFVEDTGGAYWKLMDGTYTKTAPVTTGDEKDNSADYTSTTTKYTVVNDTKVVTKDGEGTNVKAFVKEDGTLTFTGLGAGTYTLTETTTPAGYNSIAPIEFTVSFDGNTAKFSSTAPITVQADNTLYTEIVNQSGSTLPETGGIGTTIFYAIGGILLVGAAVMLVAKKRMDAED